jgi:hypothetical protein
MRAWRWQFRVRTMLILISVCALVFGASNWWYSTRDFRAMLRAIRTAKFLDERERELFTSLVWHDEQRLIERLQLTKLRDRFAPLFVHRICWQTDNVNAAGETRRFYVFSAFCTGGQPSVSTVVVTNSHNEVLAWNDTAYLFGAFRSAAFVSKKGLPELHVAVDPTYEPPSKYAAGTLHFRLKGDHIGDGYFTPNPLFEEERERDYQEAMVATQLRVDDLKLEIEAARRELASKKSEE